MTDAFDALRADTTPIAPPSSFAARLRDELADQLTELTELAELAERAQPRTEPRMTTITPYLTVSNAAEAIDFYVAAFGAVEDHRLVGDDGRVGHAELVIGGNRIMLADEYPEAGTLSPLTRGGTSVSFTIEVDSAGEVDVVFARAIALGATELRPVEDQFYGHRQGTLRDPSGHQWSIGAPIAGFDDAAYSGNSRNAGFEWTPGEARTVESHDHQVKHHERGDLYYFTLPTTDLQRAQAFFGAVLGWQFGGDAESGHVDNIDAPPGGLHAGQRTYDLWFVVPDIHAAVAQVRELGGTSTEPVLYDSGWAAECTDDQGTRFCLSVPADKYTR